MKNHRRSSLLIIVLVLVMVMGAAVSSYAFRCGSSLVKKGDTRAEVAAKCDEPHYIESWVEERFFRDFGVDRRYGPRTRSRRGYREPLVVKEIVNIDVWTYVLGRTQFIRYLTFENGVLVEITTGHKGY